MPDSLCFYTGWPNGSQAGKFAALVVPALRLLTWNELPPHACIIASGSAGAVAECFAAGCSDYIREPWTWDELFARIQSKTGTCINIAETTFTYVAIRGPVAELKLGSSVADLFVLLYNNSGQFIPRKTLALALDISVPNTRAIDMRISRLKAVLRSIGSYELAESIICAKGGYGFFLRTCG